MKLRYTRRALKQLFAILDYVEKRSPQSAASIALRLERAIAVLKTQPKIGVSTNRPGFRRFVLAPYPYIVLYQPKADEVVVHSVRHAARRRPKW